jgi:hypothetical protein
LAQDKKSVIAEANVVRAGAVQAERDAGLIEMSVETRRLLERADVKLVRVFDRDFGLVWDGFDHSTGPRIGPSSVNNHWGTRAK